MKKIKLSTKIRKCQECGSMFGIAKHERSVNRSALCYDCDELEEHLHRIRDDAYSYIDTFIDIILWLADIDHGIVLKVRPMTNAEANQRTIRFADDDSGVTASTLMKVPGYHLDKACYGYACIGKRLRGDTVP